MPSFSRLANRIRSISEAYFGRRTFSQECEDLVLADYFGNTPKGFFVDVGAHSPRRFSNTYLFYKRGWRGINIDPLPGMKQKFDRSRPRDINVELGIAERPGKLKYYEFNEPALNGFDSKLSLERGQLPAYRIINTRETEVLPLRDVLDRFLPRGEQITFMTIDTEGLDLEVLRSNNWDQYRPKVVVVEIRKSRLEAIVDDPIFNFLTERNFEFFACTGRSCFFKQKEE